VTYKLCPYNIEKPMRPSSLKTEVNDIINRLMVHEGNKIKLQKLSPGDDFNVNENEAEHVLKQNLMKQMSDLQYRLYTERKKALLIIFQGIDTSGKDSTIRHVIKAFNPQSCTVKAFKEPTAEDLYHDFLWRIHKSTPAKGEIVIFNRSHYEDIIQPRVHKTIHKSIWTRRYDHINAFERCLSDNNTKIIKFFLYISKKEQRKRLEERLTDPLKQWKISERDLEDRKYWSRYLAAYQDIIHKCSNLSAPWYVIPANKKWFRDLIVSLIISNTLEKLKPKIPKPTIDLSRMTIDG
jgi:PPK2 family polyphosphate:nucleotide phosphotransferase